MERLTKIISGYAHGAEGVSRDKLTGTYCRGKFEATACVEKLAEYETLEEQCIEENACCLRMLLTKWKEFFADIKELYEYRKLREQGLLLKFPCKVDDNVWYWNKEFDPLEEAPFAGFVSGYEIASAGMVYMIITSIGEFSWLPHHEKIEIDDFGKTVFLTKTEAEKALERMEGENEQSITNSF